jgi:upstream activation factor subunit UAF30
MPKTDTTRKLVKSSKKGSSKKATSKKVTKPLEQVEEQTQSQEVPQEVPQEQSQQETPTETTTTTKKVVSRETLFEDFDTLVENLTQEISAIRESGDKGRMQEAKYLRSVIKNVTALKKTTTKVLKQKRRRKPVDGSKASTSGFLKPVTISKEMSKFAGWDENELKSRVDVTKSICEYIREKNLQNPKDKRQIVPDAKLRKLLNFSSKDKKLTYYELQKCIQPHFPKK